MTLDEGEDTVGQAEMMVMEPPLPPKEPLGPKTSSRILLAGVHLPQFVACSGTKEEKHEVSDQRWF